MKKIILSLIPVLCLSGIIVLSCTEINAENRENDTNLPSGNTEQENSELFMDGMYFDRDGNVNSPAKKSKTNYAAGESSNMEYYYDNEGRISRIVQTVISESQIMTTTSEYEYSYKKIVETTTSEIDLANPNLEDLKAVSTTVTEYY